MQFRTPQRIIADRRGRRLKDDYFYWFAWRPIITVGSKIVWLETVIRYKRKGTNGGIFNWIYYLNKNSEEIPFDAFHMPGEGE